MERHDPFSLAVAIAVSFLRRSIRPCRRARRGLVAMAAICAASALAGAAATADSATATGSSEGSPSLTDINKKLTNPVSELWSISLQQNNFRVDLGAGIGTRWNSNLNFQPVLPISITEDWNLITRPVITLLNSVPHPDLGSATPDIDRTSALGDTVLLEMVSPSSKLVGDWLLGAGPTFIFPSASSRWSGQEKWQAGPAAIVGYLSEKWILGSFAQQWTSFAGNGSRASTSQLNLQPIASWFLPDGWSIGYSGNVLANWEASGDEVWTVPIGLGIAKVLKLGRLPVRVQLAGQYMPIRPDVFGQKWNIQLLVAPVIPKLVRGNLADPENLRFGLGH
jgi:hypothetical protein